MVANEIQSRHCFRSNSSVQSVADNDAVRVQFLQQRRHFFGSVGAVSIQHDDGVRLKLNGFTETMSNGTSFARVVLVDEHDSVILGHRRGVVGAMAVHHQHGCLVPHLLEFGVGDSLQYPRQSQLLVEHWEKNNKVFHGEGGSLLAHGICRSSHG